MHNSLDKQPAKQNAPVVAIEGCGQDMPTIAYYTCFSE